MKNRLLEFTLNIGQLLLENGAEAYRVEDTIMRILHSFDIEDCSAFSTTTGLFVCIENQTKIKRIKNRCINLSKVADINDLSRKVVSKIISIDDATSILGDINDKIVYSNSVITLSVGIACFFFTLLFKGHIYDAINSFFVGCLLNIFSIFLKKRKVTSFIETCLGGLFVAFMSLIILNLGLGINIDSIIIGGVMPLVPGVCFTNGIRDIFEGDYLSGSSRVFEAVVIAVGIALGVGIVLSIWIKIFGSFLIG